eukprot:357060-Chlamydomonas_euryale.AAC.3
MPCVYTAAGTTTDVATFVATPAPAASTVLRLAAPAAATGGGTRVCGIAPGLPNPLALPGAARGGGHSSPRKARAVELPAGRSEREAEPTTASAPSSMSGVHAPEPRLVPASS